MKCAIRRNSMNQTYEVYMVITQEEVMQKKLDREKLISEALQLIVRNKQSYFLGDND